jgi:RHS repeat-associated protein
MPKFSGKERDKLGEEQEGGLDYFGARYYDREQYRFISADPIMSKGRSLIDSQGWNFYSYCRNNPIAFIDLLGMDLISVEQAKKIINIIIGGGGQGGWIGTPYNNDPGEFGGRKAEAGAEGGCDCSGSTWKIYDEAGFSYEYGTASEMDHDFSFVGLLETGKANEGLFEKISDQQNPQIGDIGIMSGHMVIFAEIKEGSEPQYYVYSATQSKGYIKCPINWFDGYEQVVWYRYNEKPKEPAK